MGPRSTLDSEWRDSKIFFTITYILLLGVGLYHGLYGLRTILIELTLKPALEKAVTAVLLVVGLGLFGLGSWAAWASHAVALASPKELEAYLQFTYCIKCGCCMAACPTLATDVRYLGPMPLTALQRYNADSRDEGLATRADIAGGDGGAFSCHYAGECSRVCPKGVDPGKAIQHLKRKLVLDYLYLARRKKPCRKLDGRGEGKLLPNMPPTKDHRKGKGYNQVG